MPADATEALGSYVFASEDPGARLARHVERGVFLEAFGNTRALLTAEYGPYERSSVMICVVDQRRKLPAGMLRFIVPSPAGFKTLHDLLPVWGVDAGDALARTGVDFDFDRMWDGATVAVAPEYRRGAMRGLVTMAVLQVLSQLAARCDIMGGVAVFHLPVLRMLQWKLHRPFSLFPGIGGHDYLGSSESVPVYQLLDDWYRRLAVVDPALHEIMVHGTGLEPVVRPANWDEAVALCGWVKDRAGAVPSAR